VNRTRDLAALAIVIYRTTYRETTFKNPLFHIHGGSKFVNSLKYGGSYFFPHDSTLSFVLYMSSAAFHIRFSGLFPIRINLELWNLHRVGRTPCTGDQPCRKAAIYTQSMTNTDIRASSALCICENVNWVTSRISIVRYSRE
jgi:hypothetical protein